MDNDFQPFQRKPKNWNFGDSVVEWKGRRKLSSNELFGDYTEVVARLVNLLKFKDPIFRKKIRILFLKTKNFQKDFQIFLIGDT